MKNSLIAIILLLSMACVARFSEPKVPIVCQRNLRECLASYQKEGAVLTQSEWNNLCEMDLYICKSGYGQ